MPDAGPQREGGTAKRTESARRADHAAISRLTEDLLPALIAKLGSTSLGELEVREGEWHVRLRRPYGVGPGEGRRSGDRPSRTQPGHEGHGHGRAAPEGHRSARPAGGGAPTGGPGPTGATAGSGAAGASSNGTGRPGGSGATSLHGDASGDRSRTVATSPAVGIFEPGPRAASGTRVRAGDTLGTVNVIGIPQDVVAPADGIVGATLLEGGTAVEYGQELIRIELAAPAESR